MSKARYAGVAAFGIAVGSGLTILYPHLTKHEKPESVLKSPGLVIIPKSGTGEPDNSFIIGAKPPVQPNGILKYGNPGPVNDELTATSLYGAYDRRTRNPYWVAEHMTPESVSMAIGQRKNNFRQDTSIPAMFRAKVTDYSNTEYDRGHQVPADPAKWSQEAVDETFKMSNMCPQVGVGFNRHYWARFEAFCKNLTTRYPSVRVITGPLYLPHKDEDGKWRVSYEVIGNQGGSEQLPNVAVPTHFCQIVFGEEENDNERIGSKVAVAAFVLPNTIIREDIPLQDFETELDVVERASGLEFAQELKMSKRKRLCEEVKCDIKIRDFSDAVDELTEEARRSSES